MPPPVRLGLALVLALAGAAAVAPMLRVHLAYRMTEGRVLATFIDPVPAAGVPAEGTPAAADLVRLSLVYEYRVPYQDRSEILLGWVQGDGHGPRPDPVLARGAARERMTRLRDQPVYFVFYRANDPEGTAFIRTGPPLDAWRQALGLGLVVVALALCLAGGRGRRT